MGSKAAEPSPKSPQLCDDDRIRIIVDTNKFGPSDKENEFDTAEKSQNEVTDDEGLVDSYDDDDEMFERNYHIA